MIDRSHPKIDVAVLFSNTSIAFKQTTQSIYRKCKELRNHIDFDLIDETMLLDEALCKYRFLIIFDCDIIQKKSLSNIMEWVTNGGILIHSKSLHVMILNSPSENPLFYYTKEPINKSLKGYIFNYKKRNLKKYITYIEDVISNKNSIYEFDGIIKSGLQKRRYIYIIQ